MVVTYRLFIERFLYRPTNSSQWGKRLVKKSKKKKGKIIHQILDKYMQPFVGVCIK